MRNKLKMMRMKIKKMSHLKRRTMIKKFRVKDRHTQESTKQFNEITPSTRYSVTFIRG
jgi:hypothetical protein